MTSLMTHAKNKNRHPYKNFGESRGEEFLLLLLFLILALADRRTNLRRHVFSSVLLAPRGRHVSKA